MTFVDWPAFQELAKKLKKEAETKGNDEALLRSAINRAYYASFRMLLEFIVHNFGFRKTRTGEDHGLVLDELKKNKDESLRKAGRDLGRLQDRRRKADYDERCEINLSDATIAINTADKVIQTTLEYNPH